MSSMHACRYLYVFGVQVSRFAISFSTGTVAFAFIFGNSLREVYESLVWLFGVNPYDAGAHRIALQVLDLFVGIVRSNRHIFRSAGICRYYANV